LCVLRDLSSLRVVVMQAPKKTMKAMKAPKKTMKAMKAPKKTMKAVKATALHVLFWKVVLHFGEF